MSNYALQKYYLINLSTRTVSVSTHLRAENFTLKSGKCIYLGNLTDELVVKYHKYSSLNISLRILTKDKIKQILEKCINATEELIKSLTDDVPLRNEHPAGSISGSDVYLKPEKQQSVFRQQFETITTKHEVKTEVRSIPTTSASTCVKKQEKEIQPKDVVEEKEIVEPKKVNCLEQQSVIVENETSDYKPTELVENTQTELNVIEESIKQDVKDMSYSQLYDLAKARGLIKKGRPSRDKIIALLTEEVNNGGQL